MSEAIIEVDGLVKHFRSPGRGTVHALDGVDLRLGAGEAVGLVGESGCGKSTLARILVRLERPDSGTVRVGGRDAAAVRGRDLQQLRRTVQLAFQDPYASLDPRQRVGDAISEVLATHRIETDAHRRRAATGELLETVGLRAADADRFPHQLSGGQRQRIGIARALAVRPQVLVLDEPVSALDVSVRAEIVNLLQRLRTELGLGYLFISHDLGMVRHLCDEIAVMYLGRIVEQGDWRAVSDRPAHPYTRALQAAVPVADPVVERQRATDGVGGEVPDAARPPSGCRFHPRCPLAEDICTAEDPQLLPIPDGRRVACHVVARESSTAPIGLPGAFLRLSRRFFAQALLAISLGQRVSL